jgi:magnesium-transporting ATPase (P-type)
MNLVPAKLTASPRQRGELAGPDAAGSPPGAARPRPADPLEPLAQLLRDLRISPSGLSDREAVLAWASGTPRLGIAIAAVVVLNAGFAFPQEMQAERAVEALAAFLPDRAWVLREGARWEVEARLLVPGDVLLIEEASVSARMRG